MAESMAEQGVINPIEVDANNVIVTGAMRYRAAKQAGLKEVPVRNLGDISKDERYIRQVVENLQRDNLTESENYTLVNKLRKMFPDKSQKELGKMVGKTDEFIRGYLQVANALSFVKKPFLQNQLDISQVREILKTPKTTQRELTKKTRKENLSSRALERISKKLSEAEPKSAELILKTDFSGMDTEQVSETLRRIAPNVTELPEQAFTELKDLVESLENFMKVNKNIIFLNSAYARRVAILLNSLRESIDDYIGAVPRKLS